MGKLLIVTLALSVVAAHAAFAQDLGVLSNDKQPQSLVPASEFASFLASSANTENPAAVEPRVSDHNVTANHVRGQESDLGYWGNYYGWGSYYPSYYYPYYGGYGSYYPYYGWYANEPTTGAQPLDHSHLTANHVTANADLNQTPVVCFAETASGNWIASADVASKVLSTQQKANAECLASGAQCTQDLGCAIARNTDQ